MDEATAARFWAKVEKTDGCWYWTASLDHQGYGKFAPPPGGRWTKPHRIAYEETYGALDEGLTLDHACHTRDAACSGGDDCLHRRCVRPDHMAPMSHRQNVLSSSNTFAGRNAAKTHCPVGHPLNEENSYVRPKGGRYCRICKRAAHDRWALRTGYRPVRKLS